MEKLNLFIHRTMRQTKPIFSWRVSSCHKMAGVPATTLSCPVTHCPSVIGAPHRSTARPDPHRWCPGRGHVPEPFLLFLIKMHLACELKAIVSANLLIPIGQRF